MTPILTAYPRLRTSHMHLFRTDLLLMVDRRWVNVDFHYRSVLGLYTGFRVQCEYEAQAPAAPAAAADSADLAPPAAAAFLPLSAPDALPGPVTSRQKR